MSVALARRRTSPTQTGVRYGPVVVASIAFALPIFWLLVTSLKKQSEYGSALFPSVLQWANYELAVELADFGHFATNSLVLSTAYAALAVLVSALVGYGFARHSAPGRGKLFMPAGSGFFIRGFAKSSKWRRRSRPTFKEL